MADNCGCSDTPTPADDFCGETCADNTHVSPAPSGLPPDTVPDSCFENPLDPKHQTRINTKALQDLKRRTDGQDRAIAVLNRNAAKDFVIKDGVIYKVDFNGTQTKVLEMPRFVLDFQDFTYEGDQTVIKVPMQPDQEIIQIHALEDNPTDTFPGVRSVEYISETEREIHLNAVHPAGGVLRVVRAPKHGYDAWMGNQVNLATIAHTGEWVDILNVPKDVHGGHSFEPVPFQPLGWGDYPLSDPAMANHIYVRDYNNIFVDHPANIIAAGFTHEEILQAASHAGPWYGPEGPPAWDGTKDGSWGENVTIYLQVGVYELANEWLVPGRVCLQGNCQNVYQSGTILRAIPGGELESGSPDPINQVNSQYVIRNMTTQSSEGAAGNFSSHWKDIYVDCAGLCGGIIWGGAQSSSLENIYVRDMAAGYVGYHIRQGTNAASVRNCWAYGLSQSENIGFNVSALAHVSFYDCKPENMGIGYQVGNWSQVLIHGGYTESQGLRLLRCRGLSSGTDLSSASASRIEAVGLGCNTMAKDATYDAYILFEFVENEPPPQCKIRGEVRNIPGGEKVGYVWAGNFVEILADGQGVFTLYEFDSQSPTPISGVTAKAGGGQEANREDTIYSSLIEVATVASAADSITLAPVFQGREIVVINNGANALDVFPSPGFVSGSTTNPGDNFFGLAPGVAVSIPAGETRRYKALTGCNPKLAGELIQV